MKKLHYQQDINASAEHTYRTMLGLDNIATYEGWTKVFNPTSSYEGEWKKGSKIYFVGTDDKGKRGGMVSEIAECLPGKFVSIRHYGILDGDNEITSGPDVEKWAGGFENYSFEEKNGVTTVSVDVDTADDFKDYFDDTFKKALIELKALAENG